MKFIPKLGEGGIKGLLVKQIEKIVFGIVALLSVVVIFLGYNRSGPDSNKAPDDLERAAQNAKQNVEQQTWALVSKERYAEPDNFIEQATEDDVDISLADYAMTQPWDPLDFPLRAKRTDPQILAVRDLEVSAGYGALAMSAEGVAGAPAVGGARRPADRLLFGSPPANTSGVKPLPEDRKARLEGYRPAGAAAARGVHFVSITGLVPFREQLEEFDKAFLNASGYDATRDQPQYIHFYVERAEVGPDGNESDWTRLNTNDAKNFGKLWEGHPEEIADARHADQPKITFPLPPIMLRDVGRWALHSGIPRRQIHDIEQSVPGPVPVAPPPPADLPGVDFPVEAPLGQPSRRGDAGPSRAETADLAGMPSSAGPPVEYKLFRFFDFSVHPGKSYRYRVQLLIEDANDPQEASLAPSPKTLEQAVLDRIRSKSKVSSLNRTAWWRDTPWSEPSRVVTVDSDHQILAGRVNAPHEIRLRDGRTLAHPNEESVAKVMVLKWDNALAMDVPGEMEVFRGSPANFDSTTWAIRPVELDLQQQTEYRVQTDAVVLDMRGGQLLPGRNKAENKQKTFTAPGELLIMDANGNLMIRQEMEDRRIFQEFDFDEIVSSAEDN